ncbi:DnaJ domain [Trypanosoma melophagium]|uniref:DnaJ domain n=1 Tax=Trypanosoma melophagium TaxID=715481 RepID=UPI00351A6CE3|nr:DnaJ domain [Trypanosoma melophagium]
MAAGESLVWEVLNSGGDAGRLFGPDNTAEAAALKRAYKTLAVRLHPDKNTHSRAAEAFQLMQQAFETTLASLHAKPPPPPPPLTTTRTTSTTTNSSHRKPQPSSRPPPPPPPPPPAHHQHYHYPQQERQKEKPYSSVSHDMGLFDIPLPPDVFGEFIMPDEPVSMEKKVPAANDNSGLPQPLQRGARPPPTLHLASSDNDGDNTDGNDDDKNGESHCKSLNRSTKKEYGNTGKLDEERRAAQIQQDEKKHDASRQISMQLFAKFDISDDEGELKPTHCSTKVFSGKRHDTSPNQQKQQEQSKIKKSTITTNLSKTVACPFCGTGGFSVHTPLVVVCPGCHSQIVPTALGMMAAERHALTGRNKGGNSKNEQCACGKAKKGMCFICD